MQYLSAFCNGFCCMFFLVEGIYFYKRREERRLYRTTAVIFFIWFLLLLKDMFYSVDMFVDSERIYRSMLLFDMSVVFTCSFYAMDLLKPKYFTTRGVLMHIVPYFVGLGVYAATGWNWIYYAMFVACVVYSIVILVLMIRWIGEYMRAAENYYSDVEAVDVGWLSKVIVLFLIVFAFWGALMMFNDYSALMDTFYYMLILIVWGLISYRTKRQGQIAEEAVAAVEEIDSEGCVREVPMDFSREIELLFGERQIARNPQLTMSEVVKMIGTNRNYFSLYLNNKLNVNFYDFINGYRLAYAEELLRSAECDLSQEEIAQQVGFNSISTFRRAFLKKYGMTPKKYRTMALQGVLPPPLKDWKGIK